MKRDLKLAVVEHDDVVDAVKQLEKRLTTTTRAMAEVEAATEALREMSKAKASELCGQVDLKHKIEAESETLGRQIQAHRARLGELSAIMTKQEEVSQ